jgi:hypothetical protein
MYSISLNLGGVTWQMLYKDKPETQLTVLREFMHGQALTQQIAGARSITIVDDFGQECTLMAGSLHGFLFEDKDLTQEAMIQLSVHQAITQIKTQKRAQNDPVIKAQQLGSGLPAFMPGVNGRLS